MTPRHTGYCNGFRHMPGMVYSWKVGDSAGGRSVCFVECFLNGRRDAAPVRDLMAVAARPLTNGLGLFPADRRRSDSVDSTTTDCTLGVERSCRGDEIGQLVTESSLVGRTQINFVVRLVQRKGHRVHVLFGTIQIVDEVRTSDC